MLSAIKISTFCVTLKTVIFTIAIYVLGSSGMTCANKTVNDRGVEKEMSAKTIEEVLKEHTDALMAIPGVVGVGQGLCDGKDCIKVFVIEMTPELEQKIPKVLDGYPVEVEVTGEFKALPKN